MNAAHTGCCFAGAQNAARRQQDGRAGTANLQPRGSERMGKGEEVVAEAEKLLDQRRFPDAVDFLSPWLEEHPDEVRAWELLAAAHLELKDWSYANEAAAQVVRLTPDSARAWSNWGTALRKLDRLDEALAAQNRALELHPEYERALVELGKIGIMKCPRCGAAIAHEGAKCEVCEARARPGKPLVGLEPEWGDERDAAAAPPTSESPPWEKRVCRYCKTEVNGAQEVCDRCLDAAKRTCVRCGVAVAETGWLCQACRAKVDGRQARTGRRDRVLWGTALTLWSSALLVGLCLVGFVVLLSRAGHRRATETDPPGRPVNIGLLVQEYRTNPVAADQKYGDRWVRVSGYAVVDSGTYIVGLSESPGAGRAVVVGRYATATVGNVSGGLPCGPLTPVRADDYIEVLGRYAPYSREDWELIDSPWRDCPRLVWCSIISPPPPTIALTAQQLAQDVKGPFNCEHRSVRVTGTVLRIENEGLQLATGMATLEGKLVTIRCSFGSDHREELASLRPGDQVTIDGYCRADGEAVAVEDCRLVNSPAQ